MMRKTFLRVVPWLIGACLVIGCHSAPTRLYALSSEPVHGESTSYEGAPLKVVAVRVAPEVDRIELTRNGGPGELKIRETEHWSAPLGPMIQRALSADLATRLPPGKLIFPHLPLPPGALKLNIEVVEWVIAPKEVRLLASWTSTTDGAVRAAGPVLLRKAIASAAAPEATEALSDLVAQLADRLVLDLTQSTTEHQQDAK